MREQALIIRADGNSYIIDFSPQNLERITSRILDGDVIGLLFLNRLCECPTKDPDPDWNFSLKHMRG